MFVFRESRHLPLDILPPDISFSGQIPSLFTSCRTFSPSTTTIRFYSIKWSNVNVYKIDSGRSVRVRSSATLQKKFPPRGSVMVRTNVVGRLGSGVRVGASFHKFSL